MKSQYLLPGERKHSSSSLVHTHGIERSTQDQFISIPRIYKPQEKDVILGVVIVRAPDIFLIDINSTEPAVLPLTSFDNGRAPNRNAMNRLSVVYAYITRHDSWAQTELSCQSLDSSKKKSDFGLIDQGNILRCSLALCEKLQRSKLINYLHQSIKDFRIRITKNGFIWYTTDNLNSMIAVKNVIYKHELENDPDRLFEFYQKLMNQLQGQDNNLVKAKQQTIVEVKKPEPSISQNTKKSTAVDRLLDQLIKSVLDKIINDIESNENS